MSHYLISFELGDESKAEQLRDFLLEMGAHRTASTDWVVEDCPGKTFDLYERIAISTISCSNLLIQEIRDEKGWDNLIVSADILFSLLRPAKHESTGRLLLH